MKSSFPSPRTKTIAARMRDSGMSSSMATNSSPYRGSHQNIYFNDEEPYMVAEQIMVPHRQGSNSSFHSNAPRMTRELDMANYDADFDLDISGLNMNEINRRMIDLMEENNMLRVSVQGEMGMRQKLEQRNDELNEKLLEAKKGLQETRNALLKVQHATESMISRRDEREQQLAKVVAISQTYERRIGELEGQAMKVEDAAKLQTLLANAKMTIIEKEDTIGELQRQGNRYQQQIAASRGELQDLADAKFDLQNKLHQATERTRELERDLKLEQERVLLLQEHEEKSRRLYGMPPSHGQMLPLTQQGGHGASSASDDAQGADSKRSVGVDETANSYMRRASTAKMAAMTQSINKSLQSLTQQANPNAADVDLPPTAKQTIQSLPIVNQINSAILDIGSMALQAAGATELGETIATPELVPLRPSPERPSALVSSPAVHSKLATQPISRPEEEVNRMIEVRLSQFVVEKRELEERLAKMEKMVNLAASAPANVFPHTSESTLAVAPVVEMFPVDRAPTLGQSVAETLQASTVSAATAIQAPTSIQHSAPTLAYQVPTTQLPTPVHQQLLPVLQVPLSTTQTTPLYQTPTVQTSAPVVQAPVSAVQVPTVQAIAPSLHPPPASVFEYSATQGASAQTFVQQSPAQQSVALSSVPAAAAARLSPLQDPGLDVQSPQPTATAPYAPPLLSPMVQTVKLDDLVLEQLKQFIATHVSSTMIQASSPAVSVQHRPPSLQTKAAYLEEHEIPAPPAESPPPMDMLPSLASPASILRKVMGRSSISSSPATPNTRVSFSLDRNKVQYIPNTDDLERTARKSRRRSSSNDSAEAVSPTVQAELAQPQQAQQSKNRSRRRSASDDIVSEDESKGSQGRPRRRGASDDSVSDDDVMTAVARTVQALGADPPPLVQSVAAKPQSAVAEPTSPKLRPSEMIAQVAGDDEATPDGKRKRKSMQAVTDVVMLTNSASKLAIGEASAAETDAEKEDRRARRKSRHRSSSDDKADNADPGLTPEAPVAEEKLTRRRSKKSLDVKEKQATVVSEAPTAGVQAAALAVAVASPTPAVVEEATLTRRRSKKSLTAEPESASEAEGASPEKPSRRKSKKALAEAPVSETTAPSSGGPAAFGMQAPAVSAGEDKSAVSEAEADSAANSQEKLSRRRSKKSLAVEQVAADPVEASAVPAATSPDKVSKRKSRRAAGDDNDADKEIKGKDKEALATSEPPTAGVLAAALAVAVASPTPAVVEEATLTRRRSKKSLTAEPESASEAEGASPEKPSRRKSKKALAEAPVSETQAPVVSAAPAAPGEDKSAVSEAEADEKKSRRKSRRNQEGDKSETEEGKPSRHKSRAAPSDSAVPNGAATVATIAVTAAPSTAVAPVAQPQAVNSDPVSEAEADEKKSRRKSRRNQEGDKSETEEGKPSRHKSRAAPSDSTSAGAESEGNESPRKRQSRAARDPAVAVVAAAEDDPANAAIATRILALKEDLSALTTSYRQYKGQVKTFNEDFQKQHGHAPNKEDRRVHGKEVFKRYNNCLRDVRIKLSEIQQHQATYGGNSEAVKAPVSLSAIMGGGASSRDLGAGGADEDDDDL